MRLRIAHTTRYEFSQPVAHGLQRLRLTPKTTQGQKVLEWSMRLSGARVQVDYEDHNHNRTTLVSVEPGVSSVEVHCEGLVATADNHGVIGHHSGHMPLWAFLGQSALTRPGAKVRAIMAGLDRHFGQNAELEPEVRTAVERWLVASAGADAGSAGTTPPLRITTLPWFRHEHDEVPAAAWKRPAIKSAANCSACHEGAALGDYNEHAVRIPR